MSIYYVTCAICSMLATIPYVVINEDPQTRLSIKPSIDCKQCLQLLLLKVNIWSMEISTSIKTHFSSYFLHLFCQLFLLYVLIESVFFLSKDENLYLDILLCKTTSCPPKPRQLISWLSTSSMKANVNSPFCPYFKFSPLPIKHYTSEGPDL